MPIPLLLELLHIFAVFWFLAGLAGRGVALAQARRATAIPELDAILRVADVFELYMVRRGSLLVLAAGVVTALAKKWPLLGPLHGGPPYWLFVSLLIFVTPFLLVPTVYIPRGKRFRATLDHARAEGSVTPALTAALNDRTVALGHAWEWTAVVIITTLMVLKPF